MRTSHSRDRERTSGLPAHPDRSALVLSVIIGAALGFGLGLMSMAGLTAAILGTVLGAVAGALVGKFTIARNHREAARDRVLDRELGVIDDDIGRARPT